MFSLKEWNFEEYKAAVCEIEDPVDRLDELNATRSYAFFEEMLSHSGRIRSEEDSLISQRFDLFLESVDEEIKSMKVKFADLIKEREKKAWKGHVRLPYPVYGTGILVTRSSLRLEIQERRENGLNGS